MTINFTPGFGSTDSSTKTTTLRINCVGSDDLKTVVESLGGAMPNAYTIDSDNVYTSLDDLTGAQYEAILDASHEYDALVAEEKAIVDEMITAKFNMTMAEVQQAADDGIERLANKFVDSTKLNDASITDLKEQRAVLVNVLTLDDEFDSLSPRTKARVLAKLDVNSWDEVKERAQNLIDAIDAKLFIQKYIDNTNGTLDDDKVVAGEEDWNNLNDAARDLANLELLETEGIEKTYPELLKNAQEIEPAPKTGDMVGIVIAVSIISALGFTATFIKRKK